MVGEALDSAEELAGRSQDEIMDWAEGALLQLQVEVGDEAEVSTPENSQCGRLGSGSH